MKSLPKAETEKVQLEQLRQMSNLKKKMTIQESSMKELQSSFTSIKVPHNKKMKRLQCRSFPLGLDIILDGKHTGEVTPHTFEDLEAGEHEVEIHYIEPETGEVIAKHEKVNIKVGKRVVVKLYFKKPKTLA